MRGSEETFECPAVRPQFSHKCSDGKSCLRTAFFSFNSVENLVPWFREPFLKYCGIHTPLRTSVVWNSSNIFRDSSYWVYAISLLEYQEYRMNYGVQPSRYTNHHIRIIPTWDKIHIFHCSIPSNTQWFPLSKLKIKCVASEFSISFSVNRPENIPLITYPRCNSTVLSIKSFLLD